jgi:mitochondrial enoyl-[acyl-carrier protein] reductase / trans-2-enoyl-CoA reductase
LKINKEGLTPTQVATVSVNPCTAYRILRSYGPSEGIRSGSKLGMQPMEPGSGEWVIQNGANSGVGRATIQLASIWGLRSINIIRQRQSQVETDAMKKELTDLGADVVVTEAEFLKREWAEQLKSITRSNTIRIGLGLNCVGGKSATQIARSLGEGGTMVSYGGMSRQPVALPTGLLIFKDIRFVGFWLSKWNEKDPVGKKHMIEDILSLIREGRFRDVPVQDVPWSWETEDKVLRDEVGGTLQGFRKGKGVFVFGET